MSSSPTAANVTVPENFQSSSPSFPSIPVSTVPVSSSQSTWPRATSTSTRSRLSKSNHRLDPLISHLSNSNSQTTNLRNIEAAQAFLATIEEHVNEDADILEDVQTTQDPPPLLVNEDADILEDAVQITQDPPPLLLKLIDLPLSDFHHLLCITPTLSFIPEACVLRVRDCYIKIMRKIFENPQDVLWWKKLFLLPVVLMTHKISTNDDKSMLSKERKDKILASATMIFNDDWSSFTLGSRPLNKKHRPELSQQQMDALQMNKVDDYAKAGELGKAMRACASGSFRPCPATHAVVGKLRDLHPPPCGYSINNLENIKNHVISSSSRGIFDLNGFKLRKLVGKKPSKVAPGVDGFRWEHLRALFGQGRPEIPSEEVFADLFTNMLVLLLDVKDVPSDVYKFLRLNKLVAIPKPDDSIRPIGMGSNFRKLCSSIVFTQTFAPHADFAGNSFNSSYFQNLQYGVDKRGCEKILLSFHQYMQTHADHDVLCCDASNAFNSLSRLRGIEEAFKYFKDQIPFINKIYLEESFGCYYGLVEGVQKVESREGFHQGCILACWLYSMSFHPFLKQLSDIMGANVGLVKAFVDDTTIAGPTSKILEVCTHMVTEGGNIGFKFNANKSTILLGKTLTEDEAIMKKNQYIALGFNDSCIHIHPDNLPGSSLSYGAKLLGSFIGSDEFIRSKIIAKAEKLKKVADNIKKVESKQIQFLLLGQCFNMKVNYHSRTTSPDRMLPLLTEFDKMKLDVLEDIVEADVDEKRFLLSQMSVSLSGIGLRNSKWDSVCAFVASNAEFYSENPDLYEQAQVQEPPLLCLQQISTSMEVLKQRDANLTFDSIVSKIKDGACKTQRQLSSLSMNAHRDAIVNQFEEKERVIINSFFDDDCGRWLSMCPKSYLFVFTNPEFLSAIRFRLVMPQEKIVDGTPCRCTITRRFFIDKYGLHFGTGCNLGGWRIFIHDMMVQLLQSLCSYAGFSSKLEPVGMFRGNEVGIADGSKGDLVISNLGPKPILLDVRVSSVCPANGGQLSARDINDKDLTKKNLKRNYDEKMRHYGPAAQGANVEFVPCIVDIGGQMHDSFKKLVKKILQKASDQRHIPLSVLWNYWFSALTVSLYRGRAKAMIGLTKRAFGNNLPDNYESSDIVVSRSSYLNRK